MRTVCSKMSTFLVSALFLVLVLGNVRPEKYQNSSKRQTSTTFLRLTALRSDEGLWTARFGDYEISIELKHHPGPTRDADYNDTWSLKIKHTPKTSIVLNERAKNAGNEILGEITQEPSFQTSETREMWKQLIDTIDDNDEEDSPVFRKLHSPTRPKKAKARRQLFTKPYTSTTEKSDTGLGPTAHAYSSDPVVMKELAQGSNRLNVLFGNDEGRKNPVDKFDEEYEEVNDKPWKNIAAIIYDGVSMNSGARINETDKGAYTENNYTPSVEDFANSYALPLQQSLQEDDYDEVQNISLAEDTVSPQNFNPETWQIPTDVIIDGVSNSEEKDDVSNDKQSSTPLSENTSQGNYNSTTESMPEVIEDNNERTTTSKYSEETGSVSKEQTIENEDYVVEDSSAGVYDRDEDGGEVGSEDESSEVDFSELEVPPEMKRIMEWYPRSKPLSIENNGYKLFPGVGWFKLVPWAERWSKARKVCESEGAYLAIPDSKQKVRIFMQIFKNFPDVLEQSILSNQVYVGVYNRGLHRNLTTVKDQMFQPRFPIWFPGEPDNADPGEDCVTFHAEGKIRDVPCFYNLPFLCEKEPDIS